MIAMRGNPCVDRLLAVPFWIVDRAGKVSAFLHGYFARPLGYPERDCWQSMLISSGIITGGKV